jgi:hypothetical protein
MYSWWAYDKHSDEISREIEIMKKQLENKNANQNKNVSNQIGKLVNNFDSITKPLPPIPTYSPTPINKPDNNTQKKS